MHEDDINYALKINHITEQPLINTTSNTNTHTAHVTKEQTDRIGILIDLDSKYQFISEEPKDMDTSEHNNRYHQDLALINSFTFPNTNSHDNINSVLDQPDTLQPHISDLSTHEMDHTMQEVNLVTINHNVRKLERKKITTYSQQLSARKSSNQEHFDAKDYCKESADNSMHAKVKQPILLTYDATIPLNKITKGSDNEKKKAYIELEFFNDKGFIKADISKDDSVPVILLKFTEYQHLIHACQRFNSNSALCKAEVKKYYRLNNERYSSKDFKILNVPSTVTDEQITNALSSLTKSSNFNIRSRKIASDVYFFSNDLHVVNILKETWTMVINNSFY